MSTLRWILIAIFFLITLISSFDMGDIANGITTILLVISLFLAISLHSIERYQLKNTIVFFILIWVVSHFFEALSIQIGFPFGHYYYDKLIGPRIFQVPIIIMFTYIGMGYVSWTLSHVLLGQYGQKLTGGRIFLIPFVATFIMVMWDLCMDPPSSTLESLWVWEGGGSYFGVPLQNFFGWFFVVYIFFQIFALYISKYDVYHSKHLFFSTKTFWVEAATIYGIQGLYQLLRPFTNSEANQIDGPMALVTLFTMMFVTLLSFIAIHEMKSLRRNLS